MQAWLCWCDMLWQPFLKGLNTLLCVCTRVCLCAPACVKVSACIELLGKRRVVELWCVQRDVKARMETGAPRQFTMKWNEMPVKLIAEEVVIFLFLLLLLNPYKTILKSLFIHLSIDGRAIYNTCVCVIIRFIFVFTLVRASHELDLWRLSLRSWRVIIGE